MARQVHYPYIPNSNPVIKRQMLDHLGLQTVAQIYSFIPEELRLRRKLELPPPLLAESELKRHMEGVLAQNRSCAETINFLGAGCYDHYVPAVCDEINGRSEFLTAYSGDTYVDHGKSQAIFEFTSLLGELLELDVVSFPTYDGAQAACTAVRMAKRITGRKQYVLPRNLSQDLLRQMQCYCGEMAPVFVGYRPNGQLDLEELAAQVGADTACVLIQNPSFYGHFETQGAAIAEIAHAAGAEFIVYADPSSLGVAEAPVNYGADLCCGDIQPLGIHMSYGAGLGGYLASPLAEKYVVNYPHHLYGIFQNEKGEYGFIRSLPERTSYNRREEGVEFLGTCVGLWAITAAVYLSLMGPDGMYELGQNILAKSAYAKQRLSTLPGLELLFQPSVSFKEFVVSFEASGKSVAEINAALLEQGIFGGYDLSGPFHGLGEAALYCVTEKTSQADIDALHAALRQILA